jgi:N-methylhydantoinase A
VILGVDVGGTFTDAVVLTGERLLTGKAPTTPADQSEGVVAAVEAVLAAASATPADVDRFVHGMTVGTNALLEGRVARTALLATAGFTDLEELGRQARPELYRLCVGRPAPLVPPDLRVAVPERCGPDGVLAPLDEDALRAALADVDFEAAAVCLLWGFLHPEHERRVAELVAELAPDAHVSTSHETAGTFREYERCATTIVDAALSPLLRGYLGRLGARARELGLPQPEVMLSSGGVASAGAAAAHASWTVLSGPAGGAVGAARTAARAGSDDAVGLDMGGTSCDVALVLGGRAAVGSGRDVGGRALALPMVDVHTVGAGGGSIAWRDGGGALRVGPRSAGADPGPACYGRGGEQPTVTDANLLLGYLDAGSPLAGGVALDRDAAERAVGALGDALGLSLEQTAAGIVRVAAAEMAQAVRVVTVERGIDPRDLALVAFGGAGPLHAARVADELEMTRVLAPEASGVLSALGLVVSERRRDLVESVLLSGDDLTRERIASVVERLCEHGRAALGQRAATASRGDAPDATAPAHGARTAGGEAPDATTSAGPAVELRATYDLRYAGQAFELSVPGALAPDPADLRTAFDRAHEERYGYADPEAALELVTIRVAAALPGAEWRPSETGDAERRGSRPALFDGEWLEAVVLGPGAVDVDGPAVLELPGSTLVVPPGWSARARADLVELERTGERHATAAGARSAEDAT